MLSSGEAGMREDRHCPVVRETLPVLYHVTSETVGGSVRAQGGGSDRPHPCVCLRLW